MFGKLFQIVIGYYTAVPKDIAALSLYIIYIHRAGNKPSKVWPTYPLSTLEAKYKINLDCVLSSRLAGGSNLFKARVVCSMGGVLCLL